MFSGEDPLPQNWVRVLSRGTGQMYYANVETGIAQSEKPQSVTLCHQGLLGRQQSHPPLQGSVHAGSQNNSEVGQCLGSFEAPALQVRDKLQSRQPSQSFSDWEERVQAEEPAEADVLEVDAESVWALQGSIKAGFRKGFRLCELIQALK